MLIKIPSMAAMSCITTHSAYSFLCSIIVSAAFMIPHLLAHNTSPQQPLIFVFGDSTADVGTNNYLNDSKARADFPYNGIDFPYSRPTGRFSNGLNSADSLARCFNLSRSPPPFFFLCSLGKHRFQRHIFKGVNFASAGSGLLDTTGKNYITVVPLSDQIKHFKTVQKNFTSVVGRSKTKKLLADALFFISVGSNDIFDYFNTTEDQRMPEDEYISTLMSTYTNHIAALYRLGARKFGIIGVPPVGCCPYQRLVQMFLDGVNDCYHDMNDFALAFHYSIDTLLRNISKQLPLIKYSLGNAFSMTMDVINSGKFETVDAACCGHGTLNAAGPCNITASLCPDRRKYLFWDMFHPTQAAAGLAADTLYGGPTIYVSPINFSQLAEGK